MIQEGGNTTFNGSANDIDGSIVNIQWTQLSGPPIPLQNPNTLNPSIQVPWYYHNLDISYQLSVTDDDGAISFDTVSISIIPIWEHMNIIDEFAYHAQLNMTGDRDFVELEIDPNKTYSIVLREFVGNTGISIYTSNNLLPSELIAYADSLNFENNVIELTPTGLNKVYLEIIGSDQNQYTITVRIPSVFLEPGFPVDTIKTSGTYQTGPEARAVTIGNLDNDPELEIVVSGTVQGPLYAFNHDGSTVDGWPVQFVSGTAYPSIGELDGNNAHREIATGYGPFIGSCENDQFLISGEGFVMPGWPRSSCISGTTIPPMLADIDNDGVDEIFMNMGDGYYSNGQIVTAWQSSIGSQSFGQPSFGDITGDGQANIVFSKYTQFNDIEAYFLDGSLVPGFPITDDPSPLNTIRGGPIGLADLNGVGGKEIIRFRKVQDHPAYFIVQVFDGSGTLLWERQTEDATALRTVPSFGDLNGDGLPEILMQTNSKIYAWNALGILLPNFPIDYADINLPNWSSDAGSSAPLVADVTGDQVPDIIIAGRNYLRIYSTSGQLEHKIRIHDNRIMPAVADIDLDGRNEIIVAEDVWNGLNFEGIATVWVYDLGGIDHGQIQWGELGGSARHQFSFPAP